MDDKQTYLLNGLLARHFGLGRIMRFRHVVRGRQAQTFEVLTQEQHEYVVYLYPPGYEAGQLNAAARAMASLDRERFSVVPMLPVKNAAEGDERAGFVAEGPQGTGMMVGLATTGSALAPNEYSEHDLAEVGLRLGWMHRVFKAELKAPAPRERLVKRLQEALAGPDAMRYLPPISDTMREQLLSLLDLSAPAGWAHGDIQPAALLMDADHQLRTVVDFGLLHFGSSQEDLVDALISLCMTADQQFHLGRGRILLEAYDSLVPVRTMAWTPIIAVWLARQILHAATAQRPLPRGFARYIAAPESLATGIASCIC